MHFRRFKVSTANTFGLIRAIYSFCFLKNFIYMAFRYRITVINPTSTYARSIFSSFQLLFKQELFLNQSIFYLLKNLFSSIQLRLKQKLLSSIQLLFKITIYKII